MGATDALSVRTMRTGRWGANCYVVSTAGAEAIIIDPGDDVEGILTISAGLSVTQVVLTHGHYDHLGAAAGVVASTGARCSVHRADLALVRRAPIYALSFEARALSIPAELDVFDDGTVFPLGNTAMTAIATPGHTEGSVCLLAGGLLFTGDTILRERVGRTDLPGGDRSALDRSIAHLLERVASDTRLLPGHGPAWTVREARAWWPEQAHA